MRGANLTGRSLAANTHIRTPACSSSEALLCGGFLERRVGQWNQCNLHTVVCDSALYGEDRSSVLHIVSDSTMYSYATNRRR